MSTDLVLAGRRAIDLLDDAEVAYAQADTPTKAHDGQNKTKALEAMARAFNAPEPYLVEVRRRQLRFGRLYGELLGPAEPGNQHTAVTARHGIGDRKAVERARKLAAVPEQMFEDYLAQDELDKLTQAGLVRLVGRTKTARAKSEKREASTRTEDWTLVTSSVADLELREPVDAIITDPPYPYEYLDTWTDLAAFASRTLKPGGSLLAMSGQSYLPQIVEALTAQDGLNYHWTLAYLTPGGQAVQLWDRKVNTFWKPVLWFVAGDHEGQWIGDVLRSDVNDNDKFFHRWGQSESGMADLIDRTTAPGDLICDPFLGGGTTGAVAVEMGRRFIGADISAECVEQARERIEA